jgi:CheY-like chemotaxis protein
MIRVLLVDDQPSIRRGLRMRLALEPDLTVVGEAGDGATAVALATALQPEVVLMDVAMPGMDGIAALQALRAARETRHLPVVMMTASPGMLEDSRSAVEALGGSALLITPCTAEQLAAAIAQGLAPGGRA